jgi:DNA-directed RNA polymerase alpha subunit
MSWRDIPVTDLELSVRSVNCLRSAGYDTLGTLHDLFERPKSEVLRALNNFGAKSYREVYELLRWQKTQTDDRDAIDSWVRTHSDTIRAILQGHAVVVPTFRENT